MSQRELTLGEALKQMVKELGWHHKIAQSKARTLWVDLMGASVNKHTRKITLRDRVLTIQVDSAPLRNELQYLRSHIMERMNEAMGDDYTIVEVVIR